MPERAESMTAKAFRDWLEAKGLTAYAAAPILGVARSQAHRYATGHTPVPPTIAKLCDMLTRHGIPRDWS